MKEHDLQKQIIYLLRIQGFLVILCDIMIGLRFVKTRQERFLFIKRENDLGYMKGQSDLIIILKNKVVFVELKTDKGKQTKEQLYFQEQVENKGHQYLLWKNIQDCQEFIEKNINDK